MWNGAANIVIISLHKRELYNFFIFVSRCKNK